MKQFVSLILAVLLLAALLAGCGENAQQGSTAPQTTAASQTGETPASTAENPVSTGDSPVITTEPHGEAKGPLDMKAFLEQLVREHPEANAEALCAAILESPYFTMFQAENTEFYFPGLQFAYQPKNVDEASCVVDYMGGSGALIYVFVPEADADPQALANALKENAMPEWMNYEKPLANVESWVIDGKVFLAMYPDNMLPVEGPIAGQARDFVELFHSYLAEHPEADCQELAAYFATHQKLCGMDAYKVQEGRLTGFGDFETETQITGFSDGAVFTPQMSPSTFIGYVFRPAEDADAFIAMLREKANLAWNVCVEANTIITETDGGLVLFMMCTE